MAAQLTPQQFIKAIDPDLPKWFDAGKNMMPNKYDQIFQVERSNQAWETIVSNIDITLLQQKGPAEKTSFGMLQQGPSKQYTHQTYSVGLMVSQELIDDSRAFDFVEKSVTAIGDASRRTLETICAQVINEGYLNTAQLLCPDGVNLFSNSHVSPNGNISNVLTNASDFNYGALETAYKQLPSITDDVGNLIDLQFDMAVIPRVYVFTAKRILDSTLQPGNNNNDVNAVRALNIVPRGALVWDYLTSTTGWQITTNVKEMGLQLWIRKELRMDQDRDFYTDGVLLKGTQRQMTTVGNYRCAFGGQA